jgi:hypothetical protein
MGGSADGADRSQKIGRVNLFCRPYARASDEGRSEQGVAMAPRRRADIFFTYSPAGRGDRPQHRGRRRPLRSPIPFSRIRHHDVDRPLPSYGVSFDITRFAAAPRLGC